MNLQNSSERLNFYLSIHRFIFLMNETLTMKHHKKMEYNIGDKALGAGQEIAQLYTPRVAVFIKNVSITPEHEDLDITYVMVGNVLVARWSKKEHILYPGQGLHVIVKNHGSKELKFDVVIEMREVDEKK
jgi:hypothetical protein